MTYRVFNRNVWRSNPSWPDGFEPNAVSMDDCRTIQTFDDRQDAIDYCEERNAKWRRASDRMAFSSNAKRIYYTASRYEFTEV